MKGARGPDTRYDDEQMDQWYGFPSGSGSWTKFFRPISTYRKWHPPPSYPRTFV